MLRNAFWAVILLGLTTNIFGLLPRVYADEDGAQGTRVDSADSHQRLE
jgi:hypothetical protein